MHSLIIFVIGSVGNKEKRWGGEKLAVGPDTEK